MAKLERLFALMPKPVIMYNDDPFVTSPITFEVILSVKTRLATTNIILWCGPPNVKPLQPCTGSLMVLTTVDVLSWLRGKIIVKLC